MSRQVADVRRELEQSVGEPYHQSVDRGRLSISGTYHVVRVAKEEAVAEILASNEHICGGCSRGFSS